MLQALGELAVLKLKGSLNRRIAKSKANIMGMSTSNIVRMQITGPKKQN